MANKTLNKTRSMRAKRVRAQILGTKARPRLSIFKSNQYMYAQVIDDSIGKTLVSASTQGIKEESSGKVSDAKVLGALLAEKAKEVGIVAMTLDRGRYTYHGRIKALTDILRKSGIKI